MQIKERDDRIEKLQIQLAACLTAAEGHFPDPPLKQGDFAWSLAYERTLELSKKVLENGRPE